MISCSEQLGDELDNPPKDLTFFQNYYKFIDWDRWHSVISAFYGIGRKDAGDNGNRQVNGKSTSVNGSPSQFIWSIYELFEFWERKEEM